MEATKPGYFPPLTGVRAVAAFLVFVHHYNPFSVERYGQAVFGFVSEWHVGVAIFFVLSGFLITYRYFEASDFSFRQYMVNRFARIYPMYFILTVVTFIVFTISKADDSSLLSLFLNLSFLRGFFDDYKLSGISQGWSLTTEETFYLLAPLFFILIRRRKWYLVILPVILVLTGFIFVEIFSSKSFYGFFHSFGFMVDYTFFGRCFEFFVGVALAIVYKKGFSLPKDCWITYVGITVIITCTYLLSQLRGSPENEFQYLRRIINYFFLPFGGISLLFLGLLTERTLISKILGSKTFVLLGKSSYVFYLIHVGVIADFVQSLFPGTLLVFLILVLISIIFFKLIEEPINLFLRQKL